MTNRTRTQRDGEALIVKRITPEPGQIKVWKETLEDEDGDEQEVTMIRVPISSTSEDRDGDTFTPAGLESQVAQLKGGTVPAFLNHGLDRNTGFFDYPVEEMIGGWKDGELEGTGEALTSYGVAALEPGHEKAEALATRLRNGVSPVGFSIGFIPHEEQMEGNEEEGFTFGEHDLLEVSAVAIPSNPDAVVSAVAEVVAKYAGESADRSALATAVVRGLRDASAASGRSRPGATTAIAVSAPAPAPIANEADR